MNKGNIKIANVSTQREYSFTVRYLVLLKWYVLWLKSIEEDGSILNGF